MYKSPTVKRLVQELSISEEQAQTIRGLIKGSINPESIEQTADWVRRCYHRPSDDELMMHAIDVTLETYGVEAIWPAEYGSEYPLAVYCNTGDTYAATIIQKYGGFCHGWSAPYIGSWGGFVESHNCR